MKRIETYLWITKVIKSCITLDQLNGCDNLIEKYHMRYGDRFETSLLNGAVIKRMNQLKKCTPLWK